MRTKVTFLQPEERQAKLVEAALGVLGRPLTAGEQRWIEWYSWASDMEGFATVMTFLGAEKPANEIVPNDGDIDVLQALHDTIMSYAKTWAKNKSEAVFWSGAAVGAIHAWTEVAMVLGVPGKLIGEGFAEYIALLEDCPATGTSSRVGGE